MILKYMDLPENHTKSLLDRLEVVQIFLLSFAEVFVVLLLLFFMVPFEFSSCVGKNSLKLDAILEYFPVHRSSYSLFSLPNFFEYPAFFARYLCSCFRFDVFLLFKKIEIFIN